MGFWDRVLGRDEPAPPAEVEVAAAPTATDINASLDGVERLVADPAVPGVVRARALQITRAVRRTLPRLDLLGLGSYDSYSVVATATDYLPEAIGAYLRLPRDWADSRPVEGGKTSLLLLIDQLDLLGVTMDAIYDAANTTDAAALISHGRFLQERFGHAQAPELNLAVPAAPDGVPPSDPAPAPVPPATLPAENPAGPTTPNLGTA
ncbi:MAG: hypothetical protein LCH96_06615 [Actinobacteria bacterium]|nr:hypothetical protein [Actinomycetota bacterium]